MFLSSLYLHQFRNYHHTKVDFTAPLTVLVGKNGQGKTNLLESIFYLVFAKSFRTNKKDECLAWGIKEAFIQAKIRDDDTNKKIEIHMIDTGKIRKEIKVNDMPVKNLEYIGQFHAVLFTPDDMIMIEHEPSYRRQYLDMILSQVSKEYAYNLVQYQKIVKSRNRVLQNINERKSTEEELMFWDKQFVFFGSKIMQERIQYLEFLNHHTSKLYSDISGEKNILHIKLSSTPKDSDIERYLESELARKLKYDIMNANTSTGPHRDDMLFYLNNRELKTFASRGEYRSVVLILKILELEFIKTQTTKKPILLLDDVFSELDYTRRKYLIDILQQQQTIITTTDLEHVQMLSLGTSCIYEIENGKVLGNVE